MSAEVISFWDSPIRDRIRITGPGEEFPEPATVTILPVVRLERAVADMLKPKPPKAPR